MEGAHALEMCEKGEIASYIAFCFTSTDQPSLVILVVDIVKLTAFERILYVNHSMYWYC